MQIIRFDLSTSTVVEFRLYRPSRVSLMPAKLLGCSKKHVSDVVGNDCMSSFALVTHAQIVLRYNILS